MQPCPDAVAATQAPPTLTRFLCRPRARLPHRLRADCAFTDFEPLRIGQADRLINCVPSRSRNTLDHFLLKSATFCVPSRVRPLCTEYIWPRSYWPVTGIFESTLFSMKIAFLTHFSFSSMPSCCRTACELAAPRLRLPWRYSPCILVYIFFISPFFLFWICSSPAPSLFFSFPSYI